MAIKNLNVYREPTPLISDSELIYRFIADKQKHSCVHWIDHFVVFIQAKGTVPKVGDIGIAFDTRDLSSSSVDVLCVVYTGKFKHRKNDGWCEVYYLAAIPRDERFKQFILKVALGLL